MSRLEKNPGEGRENRQEGFAVNQGKKLRAITKAEGMKRGKFKEIKKTLELAGWM